ncbi:MAG: hypothetical protein H0W58_15615 [Acidobacteria bacterium]|jgi:hypothetical protein|nr:hypothetical protein [Acidobacteriota bacterium]
MQDVQNIPPPDTNSTERDDDFGSHSAVEQDLDNDDIEQPDEEIPVPPDQQPAAPVQEPPNVNKPPVGEDKDEPRRIV